MTFLVESFPNVEIAIAHGKVVNTYTLFKGLLHEEC